MPVWKFIMNLGTDFLRRFIKRHWKRNLKFSRFLIKENSFCQYCIREKKLNKEYYADFICFDEIIVELKAVSNLSKPHKAQVLNYLNAADKEIGLLINFGETSLKWERITKFKKKELR